jgi:hypothetical protein
MFEEKRRVTTSGGDRWLSLWTADVHQEQAGTFAQRLMLVQMLSNCVFKKLAKSVVKQKKDAAKSKHRLESPTERRRVEGHSYDCILARVRSVQ